MIGGSVPCKLSGLPQKGSQMKRIALYISLAALGCSLLSAVPPPASAALPYCGTGGNYHDGFGKDPNGNWAAYGVSAQVRVQFGAVCVAIQRERNGVVAGQRERSRDRVARAEVDGTPSASARAERGRQPRPGRKQLPQRLELVHAPLGGGGQVGLDHREVGQP